MRAEDYQLMHVLESDFWWFVGMRQITSALLNRYVRTPPKGILDVGCGTGINLLWISRQFLPKRMIGCDYSNVALGWCRETLQQAGASYSQNGSPQLSQGNVVQLPFASSSFDLVYNLDVLDVFTPETGGALQAMREFHRVLRPGGVALVRVAAYRWLLSSHDELFESRHRYTTGELHDSMSRAGFQILKTTYVNTVLFPIAMTWRLLRKWAGVAGDKTDSQPWPKYLEWLNGPFASCLKLEARWLARGNRLPFGLSAISIGLKQ